MSELRRRVGASQTVGLALAAVAVIALLAIGLGLAQRNSSGDGAPGWVVPLVMTSAIALGAGAGLYGRRLLPALLGRRAAKRLSSRYPLALTLPLAVSTPGDLMNMAVRRDAGRGVFTLSEQRAATLDRQVVALWSATTGGDTVYVSVQSAWVTGIEMGEGTYKNTVLPVLYLRLSPERALALTLLSDADLEATALQVAATIGLPLSSVSDLRS